MVEFSEVADRVWVTRHPWYDLTVTVVGGERGLVLIDTHASAAAARELIDAVRRLGAGEVTAVVNTHVHVDHLLGNGAVRSEYGPVPVHAHETVPEDLPAEYGRALDRAGGPGGPPGSGSESADDRDAEIAATEPVPPDQLFSGVDVIELGDRVVELMHPGRGHTRGDVVALVPDADVLVAGDLVEQSGPPAVGPDSYPLEWPETLDVTLGLTTPETLVVPGHGAPVDREFVQQQAIELNDVGEMIRELAGRGVPAEAALAEGRWPWDAALLADAVRRGYEQLPPGGRRLPMV